MNLYQYHSNPDQLKNYRQATERVPQLAWEKYENKPKELRKREALWSTSAEYSYWYAEYVLEKRWPAGEAVIAGDAQYSLLYARTILKKGWPDTVIGKKAESAIAGDAQYSYWYARAVLKQRFPAGEAAIAGDAEYSYRYAEDFNLKLIDGEFVPK